MSLVELVQVSTKNIKHNQNSFYGYAEAIIPYQKLHNFTDGFTLSNRDELAYNAADGFWWQYSGTLPVTVAPGFSPVGTLVDPNWTCMGKLQGYHYQDARNFGLVGDNSTDNAAAFMYLWKVLRGKRGYVYFPGGVYRYSQGFTITDTRFTIEGQGAMGTVWLCTSDVQGHTAVKIDAWPDPTNPSQPFMDGTSLKGLHIEGNAKTMVVLDFQGLSRAIWEDVSVWGANSTDGTGIVMRASSLNRFGNLMCSKYRNLAGQTVNKPAYGMNITTGYRAGAFQNSPSNNLFLNLYIEGVQRGLVINYGDQNTFIGGSCEANSDYGTAIQPGCRYNTFIGMGNENLDATTGDFIDKGTYTKFINIYASHRIVLAGKNSVLDGGYFERIEIQSTAVSTQVRNVTVNHWNTGAGGLSDSGVGTVKENVYDSDIQDYINTTGVRTSVPLSTTPVSGGTRGVWTNTTRLPVLVYIQGSASITDFNIKVKGVDSVTCSLQSTQQLRLEAGDQLIITWSSGAPAPLVSYRVLGGYN